MDEREKEKIERQNSIDPNWENHPNTIEYRRLMQEIEDLKQNIVNIMEQKGFTEEERQEILQIIEFHSMLKESYKKPLSRVSENQNYDEVSEIVLGNGKKIADNMLKVLRIKMKRIMDKRK